MPEEQEIETEKLHEAIHEEMERTGGVFIRRIALTTALLAVFASVAALRAGDTANEALGLKTEAARLQAEASDQWAFYQAKGVKAAVQDAARASWLALGQQPPSEYEQRIQRYEGEQKEILDRAREKEKERDEKAKEAEGLLTRHHGYADSVALFQVSIALGAIAALTRSRFVWLGSMAVGLAGSVLFCLTLAR